MAKEGFELDEGEKAKERFEQLVQEYEPLTKWLGEELSDDISKATVSNKLAESPCALVAGLYLNAVVVDVDDVQVPMAGLPTWSV